MANLIRGQDTAKITPETWWVNMKRGWEWDLDDFVVNQIGHPYQGNNYFTIGRGNGLNFWESAALTAFGSGTWEYFGETNQASLNDFINTTLGGIALGEMFHRTAWLVRNTTKTGKGRMWSEIGATAIDPMTGLNRFISGDAERVTAKPPEMVPEKLAADTSIGALWRGSNTSTIESDTLPFIELNIVYGNPVTMRSRTPYDAFIVRLDIGGGSALSEANVRGRLFGQGYRGGQTRLTVSQGYQFAANDAYRFGAQSFETNISFEAALTSRTSMWAAGWGGVTILGAVDSLPPGVTEAPVGSGGSGCGPGRRDRSALLRLRAGHELRRVLPAAPRRAAVLHLQLRSAPSLRARRRSRQSPAAARARGSQGADQGPRRLRGRRRVLRSPHLLPDAGHDPARFQFPQFRLFMTWTGS